jgi:hypothetical protein
MAKGAAGSPPPVCWAPLALDVLLLIHVGLGSMTHASIQSTFFVIATHNLARATSWTDGVMPVSAAKAQEDREPCT